jgi:hypothetical protein
MAPTRADNAPNNNLSSKAFGEAAVSSGAPHPARGDTQAGGLCGRRLSAGKMSAGCK